MNTGPILVLTDFSPVADQALRYAGILAGELKTSILLLHAQRMRLDAHALTGKYPRRSASEAQVLLADRCAIIESGGVPCHSEVVEGDVAKEFAAAVLRHRAILAVAGKCNTENTPDELVDSITLDLLTRTPCPLLVVPEVYHRFSLPGRVLVAADRDPVVLGASGTMANELLRHWRSAVTVARVEPLGSSEWPEATDTAEMIGRTTLLQGIAYVKPLHYSSLEITEGILCAIHSVRADWVVMLARQRSLLGKLFHRSITTEVVVQSQVPILVVAESES